MTAPDLTVTAPTPVHTGRTPTDRPRAAQRAGGWPSLVETVTYVIGFGVAVAHLAPAGFTGTRGDPAESLAFQLDSHPATLFGLGVIAWYIWAGLVLLCANGQVGSDT